MLTENYTCTLLTQCLLNVIIVIFSFGVANAVFATYYIYWRSMVCEGKTTDTHTYMTICSYHTVVIPPYKHQLTWEHFNNFHSSILNEYQCIGLWDWTNFRINWLLFVCLAALTSSRYEILVVYCYFCVILLDYLMSCILDLVLLE